MRWIKRFVQLLNENFNDKIKVYNDNYISWSFTGCSLLILYKLQTFFYFSKLSNCRIRIIEFAKYFVLYNSCNIFLYLNGKFIIIRYIEVSIKYFII